MIDLKEIHVKAIAMVNTIDSVGFEEGNIVVGELKRACMTNVVLCTLLEKIKEKHKAAAFDIELFLEGFWDV